jgi:lipopolysaccharide heptosyltransferase I
MKVLIVRLGSLGDVVHAIPAAAALRRFLPESRIDWLVDARHRDLVDLVTVVDRVVSLEGPRLRAWIQVVRDLRPVRYDVALDFQGLMKSAVLARASGAARVAGFSLWHLREKSARPFYTTAEEAEGGHAIRKNLRLLRVLNIHEDERIEFPLADFDSPALASLRETIGDGPFALINPGAGWPNKRWPPDRFGAVAAFIRDVCRLTPVVLWGPGERVLADAVAIASRGGAVLAPPTSVKDLVSLTRAADLLVAGDTGPLHIATAVGTPTVSLFGPTYPERNGPWSPDDVVVSRADTCGCHRDRRCRQAAWCLDDVSVPEVCAAVQRRLAVGSSCG